jgi:crotonobetainyl-CoA:carnitine CoA-transferase CaiB-like acyl-CoA transferase
MRMAFPVRPIAAWPKRWRDPQIAHRGALAEVEDGGGTFKVMNLPFRMSAPMSRRPAHGDAG